MPTLATCGFSLAPWQQCNAMQPPQLRVQAAVCAVPQKGSRWTRVSSTSPVPASQPMRWLTHDVPSQSLWERGGCLDSFPTSEPQGKQTDSSSCPPTAVRFSHLHPNLCCSDTKHLPAPLHFPPLMSHLNTWSVAHGEDKNLPLHGFHPADELI